MCQALRTPTPCHLPLGLCPLHPGHPALSNAQEEVLLEAMKETGRPRMGGQQRLRNPLFTPLPSCAVRQGDCDLEGATEGTLPGTELNPASPTQSQDLGRGAGETQALNRIGSGMEPKGVGVAPKGQALPDPSPQLLARIPSPPPPRPPTGARFPAGVINRIMAFFLEQIASA